MINKNQQRKMKRLYVAVALLMFSILVSLMLSMDSQFLARPAAQQFITKSEAEAFGFRPAACDGSIPAGPALNGSRWVAPQRSGWEISRFNPRGCCRCDSSKRARNDLLIDHTDQQQRTPSTTEQKCQP